MRLIDADALLKDIADYPYGYRGMIKDTIAKQPTVDPVKHGQWEYKSLIEGAEIKYCECSVCHHSVWRPTHYCSYCGCKMDEVEE